MYALKIHAYVRQWIPVRVWILAPFPKYDKNLNIESNTLLGIGIYDFQSIGPLRYRLNVFLLPLPEIGCPNFLEIWNPWGKVMERKGLRCEQICLKMV